MGQFRNDMLAGGVAGCAVDISLFPIDTVKTRLQAKQGFMKAGGFKGVYRGLGIVSAGSIPGSAIFFTIYEGIRRQELRNKRLQRVKNDFVAPAMGEIGACTVRVPGGEAALSGDGSHHLARKY